MALPICPRGPGTIAFGLIYGLPPLPPTSDLYLYSYGYMLIWNGSHAHEDRCSMVYVINGHMSYANMSILSYAHMSI